MRYAIRVGFAVLGLYLFWRFRNSALGQASFLAYFVGLLVEEWFISKIKPRPRPAVHPAGPRQSPQPRSHNVAPGGPSAFADFLSLLPPAAVLLVMADAFFFTDWLHVSDTTATSSSAGMLLGALKIAASLVALAVAFVGPVFLGVFAAMTFNDRIDDPAGPPRSGCLGVPLAAVVILFGYTHFYLGYLVYQSMGVLRASGVQ